MSASTSLISGVDFVAIPTRDLAEAVRFYEETLGLRLSVHIPDRGFAEFEPGDVTFSVYESERIGMPFTANTNPFALHVDDVAAARAALEEQGVAFHGETLDTGVCHMAFFNDPDGNALMLHHRYAPREPR